MKAEHVNPFVDAVYELFVTLFDGATVHGEIASATVEPPGSGAGAVTAVAGFTGFARGAVTLHLPVETAMRMINRVLGVELTRIDDMASEMAAEFAHFVAKGAQNKLPENEKQAYSVSAPMLVRNDTHVVHFPAEAEWLYVPFTSYLGPFTVGLVFDYEDVLA